MLGGALAVALVALAGVAAYRFLGRHGVRLVPPAPGATAAAPLAPAGVAGTDGGQGFLYGRVVAVDGAVYEGRLRWGGGEEAFWSDAFNGYRPDNPWAALVPRERLTVRRPVELFGIRVAERKIRIDTSRPFMARFGDLARIEASGREVRVTLKSGTTVLLDRFDASDFDDGVRVWPDAGGDAVDLDSLRVRSIELLPTPALAGVPARLHGTVRTRSGEFTGFLAWDRRASVGTDELRGRSAGGEVALRCDTLRSLARRDGGVVATLRDGRELELTAPRGFVPGERGTYVDDLRYGRVLVSLEALERIDFDAPGETGSGPAYDEFTPGRPLAGSVTTRAGDRLAGRLVFDLDESETTETLDAPSGGIDYLVLFGRVAAIELPGPGERDSGPATVTLRSGEALRLERAGDLGEGNAGMLVFVDGQGEPDYVPWGDVARVDFDRVRESGGEAGSSGD